MSEPINDLHKFSKPALIVGLMAAALAGFGWYRSPADFAHAYLVAWLYFLGITVGCFPLTMIHHLTWGGWGFVIRRIQETILRAVPLCALFFIPIALNLHSLYEWTHSDVVAQDANIQSKALYLNVPFFFVRMVLYFAVWIFFAAKLRKHSLIQDETPNAKTLHTLSAYGGVGLIFYALTVTFAAFDLGMSLEPHWFSTIYGAIFFIHFAMSALAFSILIAVFLRKKEPMKTVLTDDRMHDLGTLQFATVMLWAYTSVSQLIIIWSANQPEESPWYLHRSQGGWQFLITFIFIFQFVAPFLLLLMRFIKRKAERMVKVVCLILFIRWIDLIWQIKPTHYSHFTISWLDFACWIAVGGIWLSFVLNQLSKNQLTFKQDSIWTAEEHH